MKIIDRIKQHPRLRSAWRALRDASRRLTEDELNAIAHDSARRLGWEAVLRPSPGSTLSNAICQEARARAAFSELEEVTRHWDYSGLPPLGNTDRREQLLALARQAGMPRGTPGILEFAELVAADAIRQEPDTLV